MTRRPLSWLFAALALLPAAVAAAPVQLPEPGYLLIDTEYYGYGLRQPTPSAPTFAQLHALGSDGFHLQSVLELGACRRRGGGLPGVAAALTAGFRSADQATPPELPGLALATGGSALASVELLACRGATVLLLRTAEGDTVCEGSIPLPFRRGDCPALDARDPGLVFYDAFEN